MSEPPEIYQLEKLNDQRGYHINVTSMHNTIIFKWHIWGLNKNECHHGHGEPVQEKLSLCVLD